MMMILLGMETLPIRGSLFGRRRSQARKVQVKHGGCGNGKSNHKRLVAWVVNLKKRRKKKAGMQWVKCGRKRQNHSMYGVDCLTSNMTRSIPFIWRQVLWVAARSAIRACKPSTPRLAWLYLRTATSKIHPVRGKKIKKSNKNFATVDATFYGNNGTVSEQLSAF